MGRKLKKQLLDSAEYVSRSTVDFPPQEERKPKQEEAFDKEKHEEEVAEELAAAIPDKFEVSLKLTLKPTGMFKGPAETIQVLQVTSSRGGVEKLLSTAVSSAWFVQKLRGHVGMPVESPEQLDLAQKGDGPTKDMGDEDKF